MRDTSGGNNQDGFVTYVVVAVEQPTGRDDVHVDIENLDEFVPKVE